MYDKALRFYIKHFASYLHTRRWMWDVKEEEVNIGEVLVGKGKIRN